MAVTHPTAVRTMMADLVVDQLDLDGPPGTVVFQTSGGTTVATLTLSKPAFGAASNGQASAATITADPSAVGGVTTKAELRRGAGTPIVLCSVGTSGADIILNNTTITAGQTVALTSLTYTAPA